MSLRAEAIENFRLALAIPDGGVMTNTLGHPVLDETGSVRTWNYDLRTIPQQNKPYAAEQVQPHELPWIFVACDKSRMDYTAATNTGRLEHVCDVKVFLEMRTDSGRWPSLSAEDLIERLIEDVLAAVELYTVWNGTSALANGYLMSVEVERLIDDLGNFALAEITWTITVRPKRAA